MGRSYSLIPRFKRIEAAIREAVIGHDAVIKEIDKALEGPRSQTELERLTELRQRAAALRDECKGQLVELHDIAEQK